MDYLSICAIVKDENIYLPEWIEYHKLIGVERFYIYDNGSRLPLAVTLANDVSSGLVEIETVYGLAMQTPVYTACARRCSDRTVWMAFIDTDEFMLPMVGNDLREVLRPYEAYGGLSLNWRLFGTSGHEALPPGLQMENFVMRAPDSYSLHNHIKTIARPSVVAEVPHPHCCSYVAGKYCVNADHAPVDGAFDESGLSPGRPARINHYYTRSKAEFQEKRARGAGNGQTVPSEHFDLVNNQCIIRDEEILRFAPPLREALARRNS